MGSNDRKRRKFRTQVITIILLAGLLFAGLKVYEKYLTAKSFIPLTISRDNKTIETFKVEVADSEPEQEKGLMYRKSIGNREGMIFLYNSEKIQTFWMKNTYIPLDMLFIDKSKKIVGMLKNVPPLNEEQRSVSVPSQYVLELKSGVADELGVQVGDLVGF